MEGCGHVPSERTHKTVGVQVTHRYSSGDWGSGIPKKRLVQSVSFYTWGPRSPEGVGLLQATHKAGLQVGVLAPTSSLGICTKTGASLGGGGFPRDYQFQTFLGRVRQGLLGEAADGSAGPWPLRPQTPGLQSFYRQRQVPVPDPALRCGLGPTYTRIPL